MPVHRTWLCIAALIALNLVAQPAPFVVFPKTGHLSSPDGRFVVRNTEWTSDPSEYVGTFHSLFLEDTAGGHSRNLCDYVGVAAVACKRRLSYRDRVCQRTHFPRTDLCCRRFARHRRDRPTPTHPSCAGQPSSSTAGKRPRVCGSLASPGGHTHPPRLGIRETPRPWLSLALRLQPAHRRDFLPATPLLGRQLIPAISFVSR